MNLPGIITVILLMVIPFFLSYHTDSIEDACDPERDEVVTKDTIDD